jgi:glycosyltransferase involved in cell wall biosynthesis
LRVLVSAYACEPEKGSEPAVGWNWALQISRFHEVWVITRANNREPIEKSLAKEPLPNVHWVYFDLPRWARFWKKGERGLNLYYYLWQIGAYFVARKLHRSVGFDLVHHVTFGQYWSPPFPGLLSIPFIWGPVGGGESAPSAFKSDFSCRGRFYETSRDLRRSLASMDPVMRVLASRCRFAIAATEQTATRLRMLGAQRVIVHPQLGAIEAMKYLGSFPTRTSNCFRIISIARLIHWKGLHLALRAFARFQARYPESEYWIIGEGAEGRRLRALARALGIESKVVFWRSLPTLYDVYKKLAECDVLVHPALHETFGTVCLEAMILGRPVICLDLGGPALQVTEETGIKVPASSPEQAVQELATALARLANDPALRVRMGRSAQQRVEECLNWEKTAALMMEMYAKATEGEQRQAR